MEWWQIQLGENQKNPCGKECYKPAYYDIPEEPKEWRKRVGFSAINTCSAKPVTDYFFKGLVTGRNTKKNVGIITRRINNLTVVDCDFYSKLGEEPFDAATNSFCQKFGMPTDENNFIFNTRTQYTPSGGLHLFFEYEPTLKTAAKGDHKVDVRNDAGYIVQCGSQIDGREYRLLNDVAPIKMPEELLQYLYSIGYKMKKEDKKQQTEKAARNLVTTPSPYRYAFTEQQLRKMFDALPDGYFTVLSDEDKPSW